MSTTLAVGLAFGTGCAIGSGGSGEFGSGETLPTMSDGGGESSGDPEPTTGASDDGDGGDDTDGGEPGLSPEPDIGTGGGDEAVPCEKMDVLFVVDNSDSMLAKQVKLMASFPTFLTSIATKLPQVDLHVGVITSDNPDLVIANQEPCGPYFDGYSYMTLADDLPKSLTCAAGVGIGGDPDERPVEMLLGATEDVANFPNEPNEGFVRDDAVLVVILLSDEEDDHEELLGWGSPGDPEDWFAALSERKSGYEHDIVVLSLVGLEPPNDCPADQWDGFNGAEIAPRLESFTTSFTHGRVGDICSPSYGSFLLESIESVEKACANFTPPD